MATGLTGTPAVTFGNVRFLVVRVVASWSSISRAITGSDYDFTIAISDMVVVPVVLAGVLLTVRASTTSDIPVSCS